MHLSQNYSDNYTLNWPFNTVFNHAIFCKILCFEVPNMKMRKTLFQPDFEYLYGAECVFKLHSSFSNCSLVSLHIIQSR